MTLCTRLTNETSQCTREGIMKYILQMALHVLSKTKMAKSVLILKSS